MRRYTAVSLFSGAGGFCEGARLAGFQVEAAVEIDRFAAVTYRGNFPETPLYEGDVASFLKPGRPEWEAERHRFEGVEAGGIDLVFGGPPCQGYSQIGTRDLDDPRNSLYGEFVRVLRSLQPRVFIMENVPNMLMLSRGIFRDRVLAAFRRAGYKNVAVRVIAATDFGVPQLRKRVIFFGLRDDVALPCTPGEWADKVLLNEKRPATTVGQAIGDLPQAVSHGACLPYPEAGPHNWIRDELRLDIDGTYYTSEYKLGRAGGLKLHNHHTKEIQQRRKDLIALLEPGMKGDSLPEGVWNGLRPEKWRRLHPDRPAYTILAQMHRDLSEWVHPDYERWITVREAARLQSFHDGFIFLSSEWQQLKQIGNAVPPLLGRVAALIAMTALQQLDGANTAVEPPLAELALPLGA